MNRVPSDWSCLLPESIKFFAAFLWPGTGYSPVFAQAGQLNDSDIELIHEVITVYHQTGSAELLYTMLVKVASKLGIRPPEEEQRLGFLSTVIKDYNHVTSNVD